MLARPVTRWYDERRREGYFRQAKREGYRARSAYKLIQILDRFRVLARNGAVVDLGCAPGGWLQVLTEHVGADGFVAGIDLQGIRPVPGAKAIRGDFTKEESRRRLSHLLEEAGKSRLDAVVSDMAPDMMGHYDTDQARSVYLAQLALGFAREHLKPGGSFVCKVFEGSDFQEFKEDVRTSFSALKVHNPPASRKSSSEVYLVAWGFKARNEEADTP